MGASLEMFMLPPMYPPAQNQYMQTKIVEELLLHEYMRGLSSHSREYREILLRNRFPRISQILDGIHFGANACRACIRTRTNTAKKILANYLCIGFRARRCQKSQRFEGTHNSE